MKKSKSSIYIDIDQQLSVNIRQKLTTRGTTRFFAGDIIIIITTANGDASPKIRA